MDPERDLFPQRAICWVTANQAAAARLYEQINDDLPFHDGTFKNWSKKFSTETPFRYDDGVTIWVSPDDLTPDDDFLANNAPAYDDDLEGEVSD